MSVAVRHGYLEGTKVPLMAHLHGAEATQDVAAVIVSPFGWDDVCSYRSRVELANLLASGGVPTLRFDPPATGDSAGDLDMPGRLDAWIDAVSTAADAVREHSGAHRVVAIGIGMGALVTAAAISGDAPVDAAVLWPPVAKGRAVVRELRAMQMMEKPEYATGEGRIDEVPVDGSLLVVGFRIGPRFRADLDACDAVAAVTGHPARWRDMRILGLPREGAPPATELRDALVAAGARVDISPASGYAELMSEPQVSRLDPDTAAKIIAFCGQPDSVEVRPSPTPGAGAGINVRPPRVEVAPAIHEYPTDVPCADATLFGVWCGPAADVTPRCTVFINAGAVPHTGPNRLWVDMARELALQGYPSLRIDLPGIGDSPGDTDARRPDAGLHMDELARALDGVIEHAQATTGAESIALIGLCSGAYHSIRAAGRDPRVDRVVAINPRLLVWDERILQQRDRSAAATAVLRSTAWRKLVRGRFTRERVGQVTGALAAQAWQRVTRAGSPTHHAQDAEAVLRALDRPNLDAVLVFTEGEPLVVELDRSGLLPPPGMTTPFSVVRLADAGHTLRPTWAQNEIVRIVLEHVAGATVSKG